MSITYFAKTNWRGMNKIFGIKKEDRRLHFYIIGKTGMGKSTLLLNMLLSDIYTGEGVGVIDPHGDLIKSLLDYIPSWRINDVIYFNPADIDYPIALNVMEKVEPERRHFVVSGLISVFKKIWPDFWGPRLEYLLRNTILALLEYPGNSTLLGIQRMLSDQKYRKKIIEKIKDPIVRDFWLKEFPRYTWRFQSEAIAPIQNKVGQFLSTPLIRNIVGQVKNKIDFREVMDNRKILIVNLSKGKIGEDNSSLLGSLILTKIQLAAISRQDVSVEERKDFYLYIDEFQNFATDSFTNILSESRKYRLCLTLAHQYIGQLDEELKKAIFGNVGTIIAFKLGAEDAAFLEKEFLPEFSKDDLMTQSKYHIYLKMAIDGTTSKPFSGVTLPPFFNFKSQGNEKKIIKVSRLRYSTKRNKIGEKIRKWSKG